MSLGINSFSPDIKIQILLNAPHTFSRSISWKNLLRYQSIVNKREWLFCLDPTHATIGLKNVGATDDYCANPKTVNTLI